MTHNNNNNNNNNDSNDNNITITLTEQSLMLYYPGYCLIMLVSSSIIHDLMDGTINHIILCACALECSILGMP